VTVANGIPEAAEALQRVLTAATGMGAIRQVDAGYEEAAQFAQERGVDVPTG